MCGSVQLFLHRRSGPAYRHRAGSCPTNAATSINRRRPWYGHLKQRGLLADTLVLFVTEFGRTVFSQAKLGDPGMGRDHHGRCFSVWLAGEGCGRHGIWRHRRFCRVHNIAEKSVHFGHLHATVLHCLGIDHSRFSYKFRGLNVRLTGVGSSARGARRGIVFSSAGGNRHNGAHTVRRLGWTAGFSPARRSASPRRAIPNRRSRA